jgi:hypothetical protein
MRLLEDVVGAAAAGLRRARVQVRRGPAVPREPVVLLMIRQWGVA